MYNRYIPNGTTYTRVVEQDREPPRREAPSPRPAPTAPEPPPKAPEPELAPRPVRQQARSQPSDPLSSLLSGFTGSKKNAGLAGILEKFRLDDIDTGDILLMLILLFLFRDGDDMELVITLGLLLLLGLGGKDKEAEDQER